MLKKKLKWAALPVAGVVAFFSLNAFISESESVSGHTHAECISGNSLHCYERDCTTVGCATKVKECKEGTWYNLDNCKK